MWNRVIRLVHHPFVFLYVAIAFAALGAFNYFLATKYYICSIKFLPASVLSEDSAVPMIGSLGRVASQFGFDIGAGAADPSFLFPEIVKSNRMGEFLLDQMLPLATGDSLSLFQLVGHRTSDIGVDRRNAIERFNKDFVRMSYDKNSGISTLSVILSDQYAARELSKIIVAEVDSFYSKSKRIVAQDRQNFISDRLAETSLKLADVEEDLKRFRESNRQKYGSPQLELEESRLARNVIIQQEVYTTLKSQEVVVGIQSASSLSQIVVVDGPMLPHKCFAPSIGRISLKWAAAYLAIVALIWAARMRSGEFYAGEAQ